jgi:hypothetical protein
MSAPAAGRIRLSDPAELIAAVPHLLGFYPRDSVVLLALHGKKLGLTLRADLVDNAQAPLLAEQLLLPIARQRPTGVALVVIGGDLTPDGDPPYRALVDVLDDMLTGAWAPAGPRGLDGADRGRRAVALLRRSAVCRHGVRSRG